MQSQKYFSFYLINFFFITFFSSVSWTYSFQSDSISYSTETNLDFTNRFNLKFHSDLNDFYLYKLFLNDYSDSVLFSLQLELLRDEHNPLNYSPNTLVEQWKINERLTNYFQFQREIKLKSELGVFGKVLTHSKNLTAVILAILHIIKYRKGLY
jgi:hypothetical protein